MCKIRLHGRYTKITIINAYAPTKDAEEDVIEAFYDTLQQQGDRIPRHDTATVMEDSNAKIGQKNVIRIYLDDTASIRHRARMDRESVN